MTSPRLDQPSHLPPQSLEAEEALLGAMLISTFALEIVNDLRITSSMFYRPSHRTIFETIIDLAERGSVDSLTVINRLKANNHLGSVGGPVAVMTLDERCPAVANARAYAEEVRDQYLLRRLVEQGHAIAKLGYEHPGDPRELVSQAAELAAGIDAGGSAGEDFIAADDLFADMYAEWEERVANGGKIVGIPTGLIDLDRKIGGLQGGRMILIAGRPGMGKSALAMNIAEHVAIVEGKHVAVFNFEMDPTDLTSRIISSQAKVDGSRLTNTAPVPEDWQHISDAMTRIRQQAPGRLLLSHDVTITPAQMRSRVRRLKRRLEAQSKELGLVVIDYVGQMESGRKAENRQQEITYISRQIKSMALELDVPVMPLSQLNRAVENRNPPRPMLSDLRESGSLEQDADVVILLYRAEYYQGDETPPELLGTAEAIVAKQRRGKPGSVYLGFLDKYTKFVTLDHNPRRTAA